MTPLVVEVDGRVLRLEGDGPFRIGRAIDADVVLSAASTSRQHAEIRAEGDRWVLADAGSQFGTFVGGQPVTRFPIEDRVQVTCGPDQPGATLTITPEATAPVEVSGTSHAPAVPPPLSAMPPPAPPPSGFDAPPPAPSGPPPAAGSPFAPPGGIAAPPPPGGAAAPPPAPPGGDGLGDHTVIVGVGGSAAPGMPQSGPDLLLIAEGREHRFRHPAQVTIGRNPHSTVVLEDPAASRQHGVVDATPSGWVYTNHSGEGTYVDGRRQDRLDFDDRTSLRLGHPVAGPEVTLVPLLSAAEEEKRIARRRRNKVLLYIGAAAAVLVLVIGTAVGVGLLSGGGGGGGEEDTLARLTAAEQDIAEAASVLLYAESTTTLSGERVGWSGSGSIVDSSGLILTNAHVAAPGDPDFIDMADVPPEQQLETPDFLLVFTTDPEDGSIELAYRAEPVAVAGALDGAVIEITEDADGNPVDDLDLPTVPLGDSADVKLNQDVTVFGFPAVALGDVDSPPGSITVTSGEIATILTDQEEFDTTARISGGNSGGMAVNNDAELIGVPTTIHFDPGGSPVISGRLRMIDALKDLIEQAR